MITSVLLGFAQLAGGDICPSEIRTQQQAEVPVGWVTLDHSNQNFLSAIAFYHDHPDTNREWAPDAVTEMRSKVQLTYRLPKTRRQVWVECRYLSTGVVLRRRLPTEIGLCKVVVERRRALVETVSCHEA